MRTDGEFLTKRQGRRVLLWLLALAASAAVLAGGTWYGVHSTQSAAEEPHRHQESPAVRHPEVSGMRVVSREALETPVQAPGFQLVDRSGEIMGLDKLSGKVVLLGFLYTNCPEACPLMAQHYLGVQQAMAERVDKGDLALVLITTDPEHDTPRRLQDYTQGLGGKWYFLTGDLQALRRVWSAYDVYQEQREELRDVVVYHSYKTYLVDGQGMIRQRYEGVWQPSDVIPDIERLLQKE